MKFKGKLLKQTLVYSLLTALLCVFTGCGADPDSSSSNKRPDPPMTHLETTPVTTNKIDINDLVNTYKTDHAKADSLYKGKALSFTGTITKYIDARAIVLNEIILCKASLSQPFETIELGKEYAVFQKICQGWSETDGYVIFNTQ